MRSAAGVVFVRPVPAGGATAACTLAGAGGANGGGSLMVFDRAWVLLLIAIPCAWAAWEWRFSSRRLPLLLKTAAFVAILLALAQPRITIYQNRVATAILVDTSA